MRSPITAMARAITEEQIAWWKASRFDAADAWVALGGSPLRLIVQWDSVRYQMGPDSERIAMRQTRKRRAA